MTFKCLSKLAVTHKLRQRLNTARTIWTGTHPSLLNNSHTGRHAVKQGRKIHFTLQQASSVTKEIAFLCLASQILNSPIARFLLYTTCIVKRVSATGKYRYDHYQSGQIGLSLTNRDKGSTPFKHFGRVRTRLSSTNRTQCDTRRNRDFTLHCTNLWRCPPA